MGRRTSRKRQQYSVNTILKIGLVNIPWAPSSEHHQAPSPLKLCTHVKTQVALTTLPFSVILCRSANKSAFFRRSTSQQKATATHRNIATTTAFQFTMRASLLLRRGRSHACAPMLATSIMLPSAPHSPAAAAAAAAARAPIPLLRPRKRAAMAPLTVVRQVLRSY